MKYAALFTVLFAVPLLALTGCTDSEEEDSDNRIEETQDTEQDTQDVDDVTPGNDEDDEDELDRGENIPEGEPPPQIDQDIENTTSKGQYIDYSPEALRQTETEDIVLFFHAPWCPTCVSADREISQAELRDNLTVMKVDYDTYKDRDLGKQYSVTIQHTFIEVNNRGELQGKWIGGGLERMYEELAL